MKNKYSKKLHPAVSQCKNASITWKKWWKYENWWSTRFDGKLGVEIIVSGMTTGHLCELCITFYLTQLRKRKYSYKFQE